MIVEIIRLIFSLVVIIVCTIDIVVRIQYNKELKKLIKQTRKK